MKDLNKREKGLFTECLNSAAFRSYCILKFAILVGSFIKNMKNLKFRIFYAKRIRCHNFCQIQFFWIFDILKIDKFMLILQEKTLKTANFAIFYHKYHHKSAIFQNVKNSGVKIVSLYGRTLWCKFQQNNKTQIATPDTFPVKYPKFLIFRIFYKRSYQNC